MRTYTYHGKEVPQQQQSGNDSTVSGNGNCSSSDNNASNVLASAAAAGGDATTTKDTMSVHDALHRNFVTLAQTLLSLAIGGAGSLSIEKSLTLQDSGNEVAMSIIKSRLGVAYSIDTTNNAATLTR